MDSFMEDYWFKEKYILSREDYSAAYDKDIGIIRKVTAIGVCYGTTRYTD